MIGERWLSFGVLALAFGCNAPGDDVRTWQPSDHGHTEQSSMQTPGRTAASADTASVPAGLEEVTIVTWRTSCASCHGQLGRGDGPQGAMVQARDLSDPSWQASVTDEQIAQSIVRGRGKMPGFRLPASTVQGLVNLVRLFGGERSVREAPAASAGSASPHAPAPRATGATAPAASSR